MNLYTVNTTHWVVPSLLGCNITLLRNEFPNFKFENHQELYIEISLFTKDLNILLNSGVSELAHLFYSHLILLIVFSANSLQNEGQNYKTRFHIQFLHFKLFSWPISSTPTSGTIDEKNVKIAQAK